MLKLVNGWHIVSKAKPLATSGYLSAMFGGRIDPLGVGARGGSGTWHSPPDSEPYMPQGTIRTADGIHI